MQRLVATARPRALVHIDCSTDAGWQVEQGLQAGEDGQAHADDHTVEQVLDELRPGVPVVSLGSGTVTDVAKHAAFLFDELHDQLPLVFVATANWAARARPA